MQIKGAYNSSNRSLGLYDVDSSNTYCFAEQQRSATLGTVLGNITGLKFKHNWIANTAVAGDIGVEAGLIIGSHGSGKEVVLSNGYNQCSILLGDVIDISANTRVWRTNVSGDRALTVSGTAVNGEWFELILLQRPT